MPKHNIPLHIPSAKRLKINDSIWKNFLELKNKTYISPSQIKNYTMNDPICDWFKVTNSKTQDITNTTNTITERLFKCGFKYEKFVYDKLCTNYRSISCTDGSLSRENYELTKKLILSRNEIIYQAVLYNDYNKTYGVADLLIRCDKFDSIFKIKSDVTKRNDRYIVIDIKWSKIPFCSDNIHIRNSGLFISYKCQLAFYTLAVGLIQGEVLNKAYIYDKNGQIGCIDYSQNDRRFIDLSVKGILWLNRLYENKDNWKCNPPSIPELYPNMCNQYDYPYHTIKYKVAREIGELTLLWMVGTKNRQIAHSNGIFNIYDKRCTASKLGINGEKIAPILDKIIFINNNGDDLFLPKRIPIKVNNWHIHTQDDIIVDFETLNDSLLSKSNISDLGNNHVIYLIGFYHKGKYRQYHMKQYNLENELNIIEMFLSYIKTNTLNPKLYHWGHAEHSFLQNAMKRHTNSKWKLFAENLQMIDMCKLFQTVPIVIKGALNFSLKEIGNALFSHGLIKTTWKSLLLQYGGMNDALNYYDNNTKNFKHIISYNKTDCRVLLEIICFLRTNCV